MLLPLFLVIRLPLRAAVLRRPFLSMLALERLLLPSKQQHGSSGVFHARMLTILNLDAQDLRSQDLQPWGAATGELSKWWMSGRISNVSFGMAQEECVKIVSNGMTNQNIPV